MSAADFRLRYRDAISPGYNGYLHAGIVFGAGTALVIFCFLQVSGLSAVAWVLLLSAGVLLDSIGEYVAHRWLGHKKRGFARAFYARHSGDHHGFFHHDNYEIDSHRDLRVVLLPAYFLVAVTGAAAALGWLVSFGAGTAGGWVFTGSILFGYMLYEFVHLCDHLPARFGIERIPGLSQLREHHRLHHDPGHATRYNFDVMPPVCDAVMATTLKKTPKSRS